MGRKKIYATEAERKAARAKYDEKYYLRNRKKILKKQKKRRIEQQAQGETSSSSKQRSNVASPPDKPLILSPPKRMSRAAHQLSVIDTYIGQWRNIVGASAKAYCMELYTEAIMMERDDVFGYLSNAHTAIEDVQIKMAGALNQILESYGTKCKEFVEAELKMEPVKQSVGAVFDLWEAVADEDEEFPASLERTFGRRGFRFQRWESDTLN